MTKKLKTEFEPGRGYTKEDWDAVDSPPLTDAELAQMRPFSEVFPGLAESIKRGRGRPPVDNPRQQISLRLDPDVIAAFKASGPGWQGRINDALRKAAGL